MILPLQLAFHKSKGGKFGTIQFNLQRPHYYVKDNPRFKNYEGKFILERWLREYPNLTEEDMSSREGCIFIDIASPDPNKPGGCDWDKKIVMALSIHDLGQLLTVLEGPQFVQEGSEGPEIKLLHDPGMGGPNEGKVVKTLVMSSPQGTKRGVMISVSCKDNGNITTHKVPLNGAEVKTLASCIRAVIPATLAWT